MNARSVNRTDTPDNAPDHSPNNPPARCLVCQTPISAERRSILPDLRTCGADACKRSWRARKIILYMREQRRRKQKPHSPRKHSYTNEETANLKKRKVGRKPKNHKGE